MLITDTNMGLMIKIFLVEILILLSEKEIPMNL